MPDTNSPSLAEMNKAFALAAQTEMTESASPEGGEQGQTGTEQPGPDQPQAEEGPAGLFGSPITMILMLGILFWFIVMRPQKKERDQRKQMLNTMSKGDKVVSVGGIHGKVVKINDKDKTVDVEVAPKQVMTFSRAAIQSLVDKESGAGEQEQQK